MPRRAMGSIGAEGVREKTWVCFSRRFRGKSEARKGKEASDWLVWINTVGSAAAAGCLGPGLAVIRAEGPWPGDRTREWRWPGALPGLVGLHVKGPCLSPSAAFQGAASRKSKHEKIQKIRPCV